jgi:hypothetical protein
VLPIEPQVKSSVGLKPILQMTRPIEVYSNRSREDLLVLPAKA